MSWEQLLSIQAEQREAAVEDRHREPVDCEQCGIPLLLGPDGKLFCKFDGWRPL